MARFCTGFLHRKSTIGSGLGLNRFSPPRRNRLHPRAATSAWTWSRSASTLRACSMKVTANDERRNAARELLREVRAGDGQTRKGVAREAAGPAARSFRDRVRVREPERARELIFAYRARL